MNSRIGRCRNYNACSHADDRKLVEADDANFKCPECGAELAASTPGPSAPSGARRRLILGTAAATAGVIAVGAGVYWWRRTTAPPVLPTLDEWIDGEPEAEALEETRGGIASRAAQIFALKEAGKVLGTEHGLLSVAPGAIVGRQDQAMIDAENRDRRNLYAYVAQHVSPRSSYERVANAFAMRKWREWPAR